MGHRSIETFRQSRSKVIRNSQERHVNNQRAVPIEQSQSKGGCPISNSISGNTSISVSYNLMMKVGEKTQIDLFCLN